MVSEDPDAQILAATIEDVRPEVEGPLETPAFQRNQEDDFELPKD